MAEISWIKVTTGIFDDEKIRIIDSMPDRDAIIVIWLKLITQAGRCNAGGYVFLSESIPYTEEMLATIFCRPLNTVRLALDTFRKFGMISVDERGILLTNFQKHQNVEGMARIREQWRLASQRYRERKQIPQTTSNHMSSYDSHRIEKRREEKNKNREEDDGSNHKNNKNINLVLYQLELRDRFPDIDWDLELEKWHLYWAEGTRKLKNPKLALLNWMQKASEIKARGNGGNNGQSQRNHGKIPTRYTRPEVQR